MLKMAAYRRHVEQYFHFLNNRMFYAGAPGEICHTLGERA
jgi:hypothetical protein